MRVQIAFDVDGVAFADDLDAEVEEVMLQATTKILQQLNRPHALCDAPEDADIVRDSNGNRIGTITISVG